MLTEPEQDKSRDFICPCGKGYFSYAALFTHVKQKHNGKVPLTSSRPQGKSSSQNRNTRGDGRVRRKSPCTPPLPTPTAQRTQNPASVLLRNASLLLI